MMCAAQVIQSPDDPALDELCRELASRADALDSSGGWPAEQLDLCGRYGVYRWFLAPEHGGLGFSDAEVIRGYLRLSSACLTTTFIITQRTGACRRIAGSDNQMVQQEWLPPLLTAERFATVGISHLTTSRRHLKKPVLAASEDGDTFILDGFSPWVTGAPHADLIVTGATMDDGRQILVALPTDLPGVQAAEPARLVGLSASHTGAVHCHRVRLDRQWLLAGPVEDVMSQGTGAGTGGLQTSTLALGLADAAIGFLEREAASRSDIAEPGEKLRGEQTRLVDDLLALAVGEEVCSQQDMRQRANNLALRAAQAALTAAKGSGYVAGHPAGRWCREALFFLVWSCPQPVMAAHLCELAGLSD